MANVSDLRPISMILVFFQGEKRKPVPATSRTVIKIALSGNTPSIKDEIIVETERVARKLNNDKTNHHQKYSSAFFNGFES